MLYKMSYKSNYISSSNIHFNYQPRDIIVINNKISMPILSYLLYIKFTNYIYLLYNHL